MLNFECKKCGVSLLGATKIMMDNQDNQYCLNCWAKVRKDKKSHLLSRFPVGSTVAWVHIIESTSKVKTIGGCKVVACSDLRVKISVGGKERWVDPTTITMVELYDGA